MYNFLIITYLYFLLQAGEDVEAEATASEQTEAKHAVREDAESSDQIALETAKDQETSGSSQKLAYTGRHPVRGGNKPFGKPPVYDHGSYHGPPPPPPSGNPEATDKLYGGGGGSGGDPWPASTPDMPKIVSLDVKCEKNLMKVYIGFDKPFFGIVFSKGHYRYNYTSLLCF